MTSCRIASLTFPPTHPGRPLTLTAECGFTCRHSQSQTWERSTARAQWLGHTCLTPKDTG